MHMEGGLILCSDLGTSPKTLSDYMCAHSLNGSHWHLRHFWSQTFPVRDAQAVPRKEEQRASIPHADQWVTKPCTIWCLPLDSALHMEEPIHSVSLLCLSPGLWQSKAPQLCTECSCFSELIEHLLTLLIKTGIEHCSWTPSCVRIFLFVCMFMREEIHVSMCEPVCRDPRSCEQWTCMQRSKINFGCYSLGTIPLIIILNFETGADLARLAGQWVPETCLSLQPPALGSAH